MFSHHVPICYRAYKKNAHIFLYSLNVFLSATSSRLPCALLFGQVFLLSNLRSLGDIITFLIGQPCSWSTAKKKKFPKGSAAATFPLHPSSQKAPHLFVALRAAPGSTQHHVNAVAVSSIAWEVLLRCGSAGPHWSPYCTHNSPSRWLLRAVSGDRMLSPPLHVVSKGDFLQTEQHVFGNC